MSDTFEVTYPCFLPTSETGVLTITSEGDHCLPLLTDRDSVERFFRSKFPNAAEVTVRTHTMPAREVLIDTLKQFEAKRIAGEHDTTHVAFDPSGQAIVPRTTITEFIEYLEKT